jgi:hypothetical protein
MSGLKRFVAVEDENRYKEREMEIGIGGDLGAYLQVYFQVDDEDGKFMVKEHKVDFEEEVLYHRFDTKEVDKYQFKKILTLKYD